MGVDSISCLSIAAMVLGLLLPASGSAQTLDQALAQAYRDNEALNSERASLRVTDEEVPQAPSGYRPRIDATADLGGRYLDEKGADGQRQVSTATPRGVGLTATQSLFNGFQTPNRLRVAESQVLAGREALRVMEQTVLLDGVTAYMEVLRDAAILELQRRNLDLLREGVRLTRDRQAIGDLTRTDLAQVQSRLAAAQTELLTTEATYNNSRATFERVIGSEAGRLTPGRPVDRFAPSTLDAAIKLALTQHPAVIAATYGVDVALLQTKIAEGALYPMVTLEGSVKRQWDVTPAQFLAYPATSTDVSIASRVAVPLYQGGSEYSKIRQSKRGGRPEAAIARGRAQACTSHGDSGVGLGQYCEGADRIGAVPSAGGRGRLRRRMARVRRRSA
jgi:outer membrane protein